VALGTTVIEHHRRATHDLRDDTGGGSHPPQRARIHTRCQAINGGTRQALAELVDVGAHHQRDTSLRQHVHVATGQVAGEVAERVGPHLFSGALVDDDLLAGLGTVLHPLAQSEVLVHHRLQHPHQGCAVLRIQPTIDRHHPVSGLTDTQVPSLSPIPGQLLEMLTVQAFFSPGDQRGKLLQPHVLRRRHEVLLRPRHRRGVAPLRDPREHPRDHRRCLDTELAGTDGLRNPREHRTRFSRSSLAGLTATGWGTGRGPLEPITSPLGIAQRLPQFDQTASLRLRATRLTRHQPALITLALPPGKPQLLGLRARPLRLHRSDNGHHPVGILAHPSQGGAQGHQVVIRHRVHPGVSQLTPFRERRPHPPIPATRSR